MSLRQPPVALVTGSARGIGAAIRDALAGDGWLVVTADLTVAGVDPHDGPAGPRAHLDVGDEDSVERLFAALTQRYGRIDALVNNAGITRDSTLHKMSLAQWRAVMAVNLDGAFLTTRAFVRRLRQSPRPDARIVNISSMSARLGNFGQANYASAKAGLVALTKVTAREVARYGATANAIMPGLIDTEMTRAMPAEVRAQRVAAVPLGRAGDVADVAEVARWLCSPGAGYLTGGVVEVAGGRDM